MGTDLSKLFNPQAGVAENPQVVRNADEYRVSFRDGKGGIYESVIRFVPWYANPEKSIIAKTVSYLKNPLTQQGIYVDDPRTVGSFSPIIDMFFKFYNSGNAVFKDFIKKHISSKSQYAALVQIIKDEQHPEYVGKIKVFKFGQKLYDKINAEMHPAMGQGINPIHPIYGRYFHLKCTSQSGYNNFDQSNFFDNKNAQNQTLPMGIWYVNPETQKMEIVTENSNQQAVADYLATNSPDLARYEYTPWTADQEKQVNDILKIFADYMQSGTLQTNLQAINTPSPIPGVSVNAAPSFPGATIPAPAVNNQAPVIPPVAPNSMNIPTPAPAVSMGNFTMGNSIDTSNIPTPGQSVISGIDIPTVEPAIAPDAGVTTLGGSIGNIDDIISNL